VRIIIAQPQSAVQQNPAQQQGQTNATNAVNAFMGQNGLDQFLNAIFHAELVLRGLKLPNDMIGTTKKEIQQALVWIMETYKPYLKPRPVGRMEQVQPQQGQQGQQQDQQGQQQNPTQQQQANMPQINI